LEGDTVRQASYFHDGIIHCHHLAVSEHDDVMEDDTTASSSNLVIDPQYQLAKQFHDESCAIKDKPPQVVPAIPSIWNATDMPISSTSMLDRLFFDLNLLRTQQSDAIGASLIYKLYHGVLAAESTMTRKDVVRQLSMRDGIDERQASSIIRNSVCRGKKIDRLLLHLSPNLLLSSKVHWSAFYNLSRVKLDSFFAHLEAIVSDQAIDDFIDFAGQPDQHTLDEFVDMDMDLTLQNNDTELQFSDFSGFDI
jgi:hypothetical protein